MAKMIYDYIKEVLERVLFNSELFSNKLNKAVQNLLPYEIDILKNDFLLYS